MASRPERSRWVAVGGGGVGAGGVAPSWARREVVGAGARRPGGGRVGLGGAEHQHDGDAGGAEAEAGAGERADDVAHGGGEGDGEGQVGQRQGRVQRAVHGDAAEVETGEEGGGIASKGQNISPTRRNRPRHLSPRLAHVADELGPPTTRIT